MLVYSGKQLGILATLWATGELQPNSATGETCSEVRVSIHWNVSGSSNAKEDIHNAITIIVSSSHHSNEMPQ